MKNVQICGRCCGIYGREVVAVVISKINERGDTRVCRHCADEAIDLDLEVVNLQ